MKSKSIHNFQWKEDIRSFNIYEIYLRTYEKRNASNIPFSMRFFFLRS